MHKGLGLAASLMLLAGTARAEIAISANDGKQIRDDKGPAKDTVAVIAFGSAKPMVIGSVGAPASMIGPPTSVAVAADRMEAPMATPWSGLFATQTGGIVSLSRPLYVMTLMGTPAGSEAILPL